MNQLKTPQIVDEPGSLYGVIFDLDGTLVDTVRLFVSAYKYAIKLVTQQEISEEKLKSLLGPNEIGVIKKIAPEQWDQCLVAFYQYEKEHLDSINLFDGILDVVKFLKSKHISLGIATGRGEKHSSLIIDHVNIETYFDCIKTGSEWNSNKARSITEITKTWGYKNNSVIYVGDTDHDIEASLQANVTPILASWSQAKFGKTECPPRVKQFFEVREFMKWIEKRVSY
ncbi:MAG: HAD family hydrolase [Chloroflexi bacterium]|nr:HAD family hydrolase [Chloroflexota bacterium]